MHPQRVSYCRFLCVVCLRQVRMWYCDLENWLNVKLWKLYDSLTEWFSYLGTLVLKTTTQKVSSSHWTKVTFLTFYLLFFLSCCCCSCCFAVQYYYSWMLHAMQHSSEIWMKKRIKFFTENKFWSFSCFCLHESILLQAI